jgi:hypothetical protein
MKTRITVVGSEFLVRHYDGNRKSESFVCKCILHGEEGAGGLDVGTLRLPAALVRESFGADTEILPNGDYWIDFKAGRSFSDDGIVGRICSLEAVAAASAARPRSAASAAAVPVAAKAAV